MGSVASKFRGVWDGFSDKPADIAMVGLDGAGKTTTLYKLKLDKLVTTVPTVGYNVETVKPCKGLTLTIKDIGGQEKIRQLWHHHCKHTDGLIFIVDSSDAERFPEAKEELHKILEFEALSRIPILVFANKQDLPNAKSTLTIAEALDIVGLITTHKYHIQECCAATGDGLLEGFACFATLLKEHKKNG